MCARQRNQYKLSCERVRWYKVAINCYYIVHTQAHQHVHTCMQSMSEVCLFVSLCSLHECLFVAVVYSAHSAELAYTRTHVCTCTHWHRGNFSQTTEQYHTHSKVLPSIFLCASPFLTRMHWRVFFIHIFHTLRWDRHTRNRSLHIARAHTHTHASQNTASIICAV